MNQFIWIIDIYCQIINFSQSIKDKDNHHYGITTREKDHERLETQLTMTKIYVQLSMVCAI